MYQKCENIFSRFTRPFHGHSAFFHVQMHMFSRTCFLKDLKYDCRFSLMTRSPRTSDQKAKQLCARIQLSPNWHSRTSPHFSEGIAHVAESPGIVWFSRRDSNPNGFLHIFFEKPPLVQFRAMPHTKPLKATLGQYLDLSKLQKTHLTELNSQVTHSPGTSACLHAPR